MQQVANLIIVLSFCTATVGAAGMKDPPEDLAHWLFAVGIGGVFAGAFLKRYVRRRQGGGAAARSSTTEAFRRAIEAIRDIVRELDDRHQELTRDEVVKRLDSLLTGEYFDLTSRHGELVELVGFAHYARVWDGVATAERLLARVWSLSTDGHLEEALAELPAARAHLERASEALAPPPDQQS